MEAKLHQGAKDQASYRKHSAEGQVFLTFDILLGISRDRETPESWSPESYTLGHC
jgi:hypothetical protein